MSAIIFLTETIALFYKN